MSKTISVFPVQSDHFGRVLYSTALLNFGYEVIGSLGNIDLSLYLSSAEMNSLSAPKRLGEMDYDTMWGDLRCMRYYPFGIKPKEDERSFLLGKGIADRIELIVVKDLMKRFGLDTDIISRGVVSDWRLGQLARRGIKAGVEYPLWQYVERLEKSLGLREDVPLVQSMR